MCVRVCARACACPPCVGSRRAQASRGVFAITARRLPGPAGDRAAGQSPEVSTKDSDGGGSSEGGHTAARKFLFGGSGGRGGGGNIRTNLARKGRPGRGRLGIVSDAFKVQVARPYCPQGPQPEIIRVPGDELHPVGNSPPPAQSPVERPAREAAPRPSSSR